MSDTNELAELATGLRLQQSQLWAVIECLEHGRRELAPRLEELSWRGPAHAAYLAARWAFDQEVTLALETLRSARESTTTALDTLASRG